MMIMMNDLDLLSRVFLAKNFPNEKSHVSLGIAKRVSDQQIQSYPLDFSLLTRQVNKFVEEIQNILYAKALGKRVGTRKSEGYFADHCKERVCFSKTTVVTLW